MQIKEHNAAEGRQGKVAAIRRPGLDLDYLFSALLAAAVALASVGLVLYFGYHFANSLTADVTVAPAYDITESEYRRAVGYILRSERVIEAPVAGTPNYLTDDGERLGIGESICDIYASVTDELKTRVDEIDRELALLGSTLGTGVVQTGLPEALREARTDYELIMAELSGGGYREASALSDGFLAALGRIEVLEGGTEEARARIAALNAEREALLASYGKSIASVAADGVGYFFRDCDGYESLFDPALTADMTVGDFASLIKLEPEDTSRAVGKMIDDPKWYLCVPLSAEEAVGFSAGKAYDITFNDNGAYTVSMTLERLVTDLEDHDGDGDRAEALLIFWSKEMTRGFKYLRVQDVSIELARYNGYRIPITAVRYYEGMTGVYTLNGGYVFFRQIDVIYEGNGYVIAADYADAEPGRPLTYTVLGFSDSGSLDDYASLHSLAETHGWQKRIYDNGGIPLPKGRTLRYFYHLDDLEEVILTGKELYHGKALD